MSPPLRERVLRASPLWAALAAWRPPAPSAPADQVKAVTITQAIAAAKADEARDH